MREKGDGLRPVLPADLFEFARRKVERGIPGDFLEGLLAPLPAAAQKRFLQAVGIVEETRAPGPARTEASPREGMLGIADDLRDPAVLDVRQDAALPEAELAEGRHDPVAVGGRIMDTVGIESPPVGKKTGPERGRPEARPADPDEVASGSCHRLLEWFAIDSSSRTKPQPDLLEVVDIVIVTRESSTLPGKRLVSIETYCCSCV